MHSRMEIRKLRSSQTGISYSYKAPNVTIETSANTFTGRIDGDVLSIHIFDRDLTLKKVR